MLSTFFGRQGSELAPEDAAALDTHIASCPKCAELVKFERAFDDRIANAMLAVPIPAGLKGRLLDSVSAHRGAWYRQKFYALAGLAAAVVLGVVGIVAWQIGTAPELSVTAIVADADAKARDPMNELIVPVLGPRGLEFNPERRFDLNQLATAGAREFQGRQDVPFLHFVNGAKNAQATVYVVRDRDFNWKNLPQDGSSVASVYGFQVAVLRDSRRTDVGYIVVFTGAGLELFLEERSQA
jgi:anti-sigma factor RsiW